MKIAHVGPNEIFHRYLTPKWAFLPTSGAGAAIDGGRFNRPGVEALYLSQAPQTALEEYKQGASISPPATLAAYKITLAEVADLSRGFDPEGWDGAWKEWDCAWRQIARIDRKSPPSWKLADQVIIKGIRGILFPSLRHAGGTNLVIFPANLVEGDVVEVHDPDHRLPRDQSSWREIAERRREKPICSWQLPRLLAAAPSPSKSLAHKHVAGVHPVDERAARVRP